MNLLESLSENFSCPEGGSFERFMELALYDREHGYYGSNIGTVGGQRGDFSTSATVSAALGEALASWYVREVSTNWHDRSATIEIGGGTGILSADFLSSIPLHYKIRALHRMVETSPSLMKSQQETLGKLSRAKWFADVSEAITSKTHYAIFSNELVDAFPVIQLRWDSPTREWFEVFVKFDPERGLSEHFRRLDQTRPNFSRESFATLRHFSQYPPEDGQRVELHASYRSWLRDTVQHLPIGSDMLTIDYGSEDAGEIYAKRPGGTIRAYHKRQRLTGPAVYRLFGRQDITADVNFTDLREWGETFGMETVACESQADFLQRHLHDKPSLIAHRETQYLLSEDGAGTAFRVLHQRKVSDETAV